MEAFISLFSKTSTKGSQQYQKDREKSGLAKSLDQMEKNRNEIGRSGIILPLKPIRETVDRLQVTVSHMAARWNETEASKVKSEIADTRKTISDLRNMLAVVIENIPTEQALEGRQQLADINGDIRRIQFTLDDGEKELDKRPGYVKGDNSTIGQTTDFVRDGLKQGWVPDPKGEGTYQYQSKEEFEHLKKRGVDQTFDEKDMVKLDILTDFKIGAVGVRQGQDMQKALERLGKERGTAAKLRSGMTDLFNERLATEGPLKQGVLNNAAMAKKLAAALGGTAGSDDMLVGEGLLTRAMGDTEGQGQIAKGTTPGTIKTSIDGISGRASGGKLDPGDANTMQQFISAFVDGLTEVTEGKPDAVKQFNLVWPEMAKQFGLKDSDKDKLLQRVEVYKKLANGVADTGDSGKKIRKTYTRAKPPNKRVPDSGNTIDDEEALISNDISGSMHSQFLAMELAETLSGTAVDEFGQPIEKLKSPGESVQVKDKDVLNARMVDALTLTAGGKLNGGKGDDFVMHTAYEMINGAQAMIGFPNKINQKEATSIMELLQKGKKFTEAMEETMPDEVFPWTVSNGKDLDERVSKNKGKDADLQGVVEDVLGFPNILEKMPTKLERLKDEKDDDYVQRCYKDFTAKVLEAVKSGKGCSEAIAELMPDSVLPWEASDKAALDKKVTRAIQAVANDDKKDLNIAKVVSGKIYDILEFAQKLRAPRPDKVKEVADQITEGKKTFTEAMAIVFPEARFPWT